ncbi:DNA-binding protein [[Haemophilus] ducreyi]|uniref:HTH cro/C1-type domain-containing protein n=1 Tax=Haemophilus ducreyi (strain 35000HP / ATCC 700724) TaxID=233412 RepID=Q7VP18_HAEDU|nr:helix-turn-helix transcriptional regulator [[Haemophilus] ducreyi]AAP95271.1 hypothetical protein HD_0292 [[Haemophilus] ducreyi 35000HP]AKO33295.1 DNA-binding protein [[Haemophilus] ducreyi]AKO39178.1 DNA-binding protein [[Haemophilus] ducreyi]ANF61118.1 DNA-binding protein [[Haemophilus] ducreyi]ANF63027.1 DNA-binding protein [[Haemophilus] ducreyi]
MGINERLRHVIEAQKMTIKGFAETVDIPLRSVHNYLSGEREPSADALTKISNKLNINLNWLLLDQGEMYLNQSSDLTLNADEMNLLTQYRQTHDSGKRILQATSKIILDELK